MYTPGHFRVDDPRVLADAARRIGAGHLITVGPDGAAASFVPLLVSDDATAVSGHLARANPQWRTADTSVPVLLTWVGPHGYVSPGWYPSKTEHGKVVPTWDYIAVEARGTVTFHAEDDWKRAQVSALTDSHETGLDTPWSVADAPEEYVDGMVRAIVGFDVEVTSLEGAWKLSQNRSDKDIDGVVAGLRARTGDGQAAAVADSIAVAAGLAATVPPAS